jgi:hypothetical protein
MELLAVLTFYYEEKNLKGDAGESQKHRIAFKMTVT